jgi:hypothetical protein
MKKKERSKEVYQKSERKSHGRNERLSDDVEGRRSIILLGS